MTYAYELNEDQTRAISDNSIFGITAYTLERAEGELIGTHAGIFQDVDRARAWLRGEDAAPLVVYGSRGVDA